MTNRDVFDLLRAGDPAAPATLPDAHSSVARSIRANVMANTQLVPERGNRRRVVAVAILIVVLATAAAWVLSNRDVTDPEGILCYEAPTLDSSAVVAFRDGEATTGACASLWLDQTLPISDELPSNDNPPLVGCVTETGQLAVFPSTDRSLCAELGLAEPTDATGLDPLVGLRQRLVAAINPETCLTIQRAEQVAQEELSDLEIEDWSVEAQRERIDRPCASISIDISTNTIVIVPVPKP